MVAIPLTSKLVAVASSYTRSPVTLRSPPMYTSLAAVTIPAKTALPLGLRAVSYTHLTLPTTPYV